MSKLPYILMLSLLVTGTGMAPFPAPRDPLDTIYVDQTLDPPGYQSCTSEPNDCSLRGAVAMSNSTLATVDTIIVPAGVYSLSLSGVEDNNEYGDLDIWAPVNIVGAGWTATIIQASPSWDQSTDRVMHIFNWEGTVTISDLSIVNGKISSGAGGAGIFQSSSSSTVVLERLMISDNHITSSVDGAGILVKGNMTIIDSTVEENGSLGDGGGIYSDIDSQLTINRSTIAFNDASMGAGLFMFDDATLRNVTIYHNNASISGGGITQWEDTTLTLYNVTFNGNRLLSSNLTGWAIENHGSVTAYATIFASDSDKYPCESNTITGFSNLSTNTGCGTGFLIADPLLDMLGINGGYTQTSGLLPGSPAIDGGNNSFCLLEDQRGIVRPLDGDGNGTDLCDIGAFEVLPVAAFLPMVKKP